MATLFEYWRINASLISEDRVEEVSSPHNLVQQRQTQKTIWQVERELGRGTFGHVRLERNTSSGKTRAVKKIVLDHDEYEKELLALVEFSKARYRNAAVFVDFLGWFGKGPDIYFVMEYLALGDLESNVKARSGRLPPHEVKEISRQILSGLEIMHGENFIHRDLKPKNILVVSSSPWHVKLADFGASKRLTESIMFNTKCGTPLFQAPEIRFDYFEDEHDGSRMTSAVDIWASGCIVYKLLTGVLPFPSDSTRLKSYCKGTSTLPQNALLDSESMAFIQLLLAPRYQERPLASVALKHSWFGSNEHTGISDLSVKGSQSPEYFQDSDDESISELDYNTMSHLGLKSTDLETKSIQEHQLASETGGPSESTLKPKARAAARLHQSYQAPYVEDGEASMEPQKAERSSSPLLEPFNEASMVSQNKPRSPSSNSEKGAFNLGENTGLENSRPDFRDMPLVFFNTSKPKANVRDNTAASQKPRQADRSRPMAIRRSDSLLTQDGTSEMLQQPIKDYSHDDGNGRVYYIPDANGVVERSKSRKKVPIRTHHNENDAVPKSYYRSSFKNLPDRVDRIPWENENLKEIRRLERHKDPPYGRRSHLNHNDPYITDSSSEEETGGGHSQARKEPLDSAWNSSNSPGSADIPTSSKTEDSSWPAALPRERSQDPRDTDESAGPEPVRYIIDNGRSVPLRQRQPSSYREKQTDQDAGPEPIRYIIDNGRITPLRPWQPGQPRQSTSYRELHTDEEPTRYIIDNGRSVPLRQRQPSSYREPQMNEAVRPGPTRYIIDNGRSVPLRPWESGQQNPYR